MVSSHLSTVSKATPGQQWRSSSSWWRCGGQWPVFQVPETAVATWAEHTRRESRRGLGSSTHEGAAIGEGHRRVGRQRVSRSTVAGVCSRGSPPSSSGAADGGSSRRVSSFHPTFSKSIDSDGAGGRSGAVDQTAATQAPQDPTLARSAQDPFPSLHPTCRGAGAKCCSVSASGKRQICSDGHVDRSWGNCRASGTESTPAECTNDARRPAQLRSRTPPEILRYQEVWVFNLHEDEFPLNLRTAFRDDN